MFFMTSCGTDPAAEKGDLGSATPVDKKNDGFDAFVGEEPEPSKKDNADASPAEGDEDQVRPDPEPQPEEPSDEVDEEPKPEPEGTDMIDGLRVMNGEQDELFHSKDHPYGVFVVESYFLTCPYCNQNAPAVSQLALEYEAESRVHVLDVSVDCRESQYRNWISKHRPKYKVLNDCGGRSLLRSQLGISSFPTTVVVDCKGEEVYRTSGLWNAVAAAKVRNAVDSALNYCVAE
jgi:hypothetical protein